MLYGHIMYQCWVSEFNVYSPIFYNLFQCVFYHKKFNVFINWILLLQSIFNRKLWQSIRLSLIVFKGVFSVISLNQLQISTKNLFLLKTFIMYKPVHTQICIFWYSDINAYYFQLVGLYCFLLPHDCCRISLLSLCSLLLSIKGFYKLKFSVETEKE